MATAPTTPASYYPPSAYPPVHPGLVGQTPTAPGTMFFPEAPGYKHFAAVLFCIAGFFTFLGLGIGIALGGLAWLFLLLAPVFVVFGINRRMQQSHMDCVCDANGLTVRKAKGSTPLPPVYVPWNQIQQTQCGRIIRTSVDANSGSETQQEYLTFQVVSAATGTVQIDATRVQNLPGIIHMSNQYTTQLGYLWLPAAQAAQYRVLARTGKYWQVAR